jgi:hypothetical protein
VLCVYEKPGQSPADDLVIGHLECRPDIGNLPPEAGGISFVSLRNVIPETVVSLQRGPDRLNLKFIYALAGSSFKIAPNQDRKVYAQFLADTQQDRQPASTPCTSLNFLDPALGATYAISKKLLSHAAPLPPVCDARAQCAVILRCGASPCAGREVALQPHSNQGKRWPRNGPPIGSHNVCDLDHENGPTIGTTKETSQPSGKGGETQLNQAEQAMQAAAAAASDPGGPPGGGPQPATAGSPRWQRLDSGLSNVARIYDALLGGCFL